MKDHPADVRIKRVYEPPGPDDGYRVLIDHIWPRGMTRQRARVDEWRRELAPSDELRRWFAHDPAKFDLFRTRYREELDLRCERVAELRQLAKRRPVTIVYAARDRDHNNAVVLAELLLEA